MFWNAVGKRCDNVIHYEKQNVYMTFTVMKQLYNNIRIIISSASGIRIRVVIKFTIDVWNLINVSVNTV